MSNPPITFCISVFNGNINYLRLSIESIIKYSYYQSDIKIILYNEYTKDYDLISFHKLIKEIIEKYPHISLINANSEDFNIEKWKRGYYTGIGGGMNFCAEKVNTDYIMFIHSDMVMSKNFDLECLNVFKKYPNEKLWVNPYRFQPNVWNEEDRPGTSFFPFLDFGYSSKDFKEIEFINSAEQFSKDNPNIEFKKGEGVSGLIRKEHWLEINGNDPRYLPAFWEDTDIFLRCQLAGFKFIVTSNSVVFHFGSRSENNSFPDDKGIIENQKPIRSIQAIKNEQHSAKQFYDKWKFWPIQNEHGFVTFPSNVDIKQPYYQNLIKLKIEDLPILYEN